MKFYLFSIVLIAVVGSALSQSFFKDIHDAAQKDLIHPVGQAAHDAASSVVNFLRHLLNLGGRTKRDLLNIPAIRNLGLGENSDMGIRRAIEKGANYLISKRQLPTKAINGIADFLRHFDDVTGVTFNIDMKKKPN